MGYFLESILVCVLILASVYFDAVSDAYIDTKKKRNHTFETLSLLALMLAFVLFSSNDLILVGYYILVRTGWFNSFYNEYRKLKPYYLGDSNKYDKLMKELPVWFYISFLYFMKAMSFILMVVYMLYDLIEFLL